MYTKDVTLAGIDAAGRIPARPLRRRHMAGWYNPGQLLRTGSEVIISTLFGKHSDSRLLDAVATEAPRLDYRSPDYLDEDGSFGFDYIADTGDGWHSTYSIAHALSKPVWTPKGHAPLRRGKLLILGGDLVYPYPSRQLYHDRLIVPFTVASQELPADDHSEVLAIPGNHDWYDSLVNFRRLFCSHSRFASRATRQTRSYFAARLPAGWWIFGLDVQLDGDLDEPQFRFFESVARSFDDHDRVIACLPEPIWIARWEAERLGVPHPPSLVDRLAALLEHRLRVCVAGDLHHYQRHSDDDNHHLVTCGVGGAFLHPTHRCPTDPQGRFRERVSFPERKTSFWLTFRNLRFVTRNPRFGIVPAIAYLLASWQNGLAVGEKFSHVQIAEMGMLGLSRWREAAYAGFHSALLSPVGMAFYAVILCGFVFFADRRSNLFRFTIGTLHALTHVAAGFLIYWFAAYVAISMAGLPPKSVPQYMMTGTIIFVVSWVVGSVLLGAYLLVSLNVFGLHQNEAFSSLRIQDWKGFLRCRIGQDGALTMRFIGFRKIPRQWREVSLGEGKVTFTPTGDKEMEGELIDEITIR